MNKPEILKHELTPTIVAQRYLGQPVKSDRLGMWYKSPFRNERTASFLVNDVKGIHDFGTSMHYDIISFLQEWFRIDFLTAINKLSHDFGIIGYGQSSEEVKAYLKEVGEEQQQIKNNLDSWFNRTFSKLCDELHTWQTIRKHVRGEALAITYAKEQYLEYLIDLFINTTEDRKIDLWKDREGIEKCLNFK